MNKFVTGLCVLLFSSHPVRAWNAEGHMIIAQIAYNHLNPDVKAKCDSFIAVPLTYSSSGTSTFVTAAAWADDFKSKLGTGEWHYIDLPFSLDGTPTTGVAVASFDVVQAINLCIATLQNPGETQSNQAVSLRYLLHFVGDIQQPLHCSTAVTASRPGGDAGGNGFYINGDWSNLHSLWDSGGGYLTDSLYRPLSASGQNILNAKVAAVEAAYPYDYSAHVGNIPDPMNWAEESLDLAQTVAYVSITRNTSPSTAYLNTAMATTEQRMAAGGHRLADLLNTIFAPNPITLTLLSPADGSFSFSWNAIPNSTYHVQWKQQLSDPTWNELTNISATSNSISFSEERTESQRFYRVVQ
ncbi:MAG TPA: S1/P1 nuclease [Verrucomicrobiae bacterium]|nr:S1/P1 nuclease [Verrucomicrobiae bacterium]